MRILVVHRYFWPDTPPYASILREIAGRWAADGHDVTVFTAQPSYSPEAGISRQPWLEQLDGFTVRRVRLLPESKANVPARVINAILFVVFTMVEVFRRPYDTVMAATTPPVLIGAGVRLATRLKGSSFIYHNQDIHPEISMQAGVLADTWSTRALGVVDRWTCRRSDVIVVLSEDMATTHVERGTPPTTLRVINNFLPPGTEAAAETQESLNSGAEVLDLAFVGNIGSFQGLEEVVEAARLLQHRSDVRFHFVGEGAARSRLEQQAADLSAVRFYGQRSASIALALTGTADLAVVSLAPGLTRYAYPSKTVTCLRAGTPLLLVADHDSQLSRMVEAAGVGVVCPPGDAEALARTIDSLADHPTRLNEMQSEIAAVYGYHFHPGHLLDRWSALATELSERHDGAEEGLTMIMHQQNFSGTYLRFKWNHRGRVHRALVKIFKESRDTFPFRSNTRLLRLGGLCACPTPW